ncbi:uncharacterized protein LOC119218234 isoform X2 [Pungitius pungitius]|uniref:uncharacterized protein LOC119218234 isoform X2 n=1 Tax=Pungitius pungitius TaxID=134920 RepID=UPI002E0E43F7
MLWRICCFWMLRFESHVCDGLICTCFFQRVEGLLDREMNPSDNMECPGLPHAYPICLPQGQWEERRGEEDIQLSRSCCTAEVPIERGSLSPITEYWGYSNDQHNMADCAGGGTFTSPRNTPVTPGPCPVVPVPGSAIAAAFAASTGGTSSDTCAPISPVCSPTSSDWDAPSPGCCDGDPVCAAAHLHLLGESLSLIGHHLQETNKTVSASSSASLLLDSLLCAVAPLIGLTAQRSTLENISYLMPGL